MFFEVHAVVLAVAAVAVAEVAGACRERLELEEVCPFVAVREPAVEAAAVVVRRLAGVVRHHVLQDRPARHRRRRRQRLERGDSHVAGAELAGERTRARARPDLREYESTADKARPEESRPEIALNRGTLCRKSQQKLTSSLRLASPITP